MRRACAQGYLYIPFQDMLNSVCSITEKNRTLVSQL
jgi:hypothetical protein